MNRKVKIRGQARLAVLLLVGVLAFAPSVLGQGCSMCYANAQQQQAKQARALNIGILLLLVPSLLVFGGVIVTAVRRRQ